MNKAITKATLICCDECMLTGAFVEAVIRAEVKVTSIKTGEKRARQRDLCAAHAGTPGSILDDFKGSTLAAPRNLLTMEVS